MKYTFEYYQSLIEDHFNSLSKKVFSENELRSILEENRNKWSVPKTKKFSSFLHFLINKSYLISTVFNGITGNKLVYSWKTEEEFTVISGLKSNAYYTHFTSMFLNGLTLQIPKTYYLNFEHSKKFVKGNISQGTIDKAFSKDQRKSNVSYSFLDRKIILINGKNTGNLGVITKSTQNENYRYTDLERTIIDISIRPAYSGGVFEVLEAYKNVIQKLKVNKLKKYLLKLYTIYPYHQVIGFYLERAGYPESSLKLFEFEMPFKFYLTYNIRSKEYSERWKLYYPKGF